MEEVRNGEAELRGDDARHLTRVLRAEAGQQYEISDGQAAYLAAVAEARGDCVLFRVVEPVSSPELPVRLTLLAALFKFDRFEWMIEKVTELGADRIVPMETARSEKGLFEASRKRAERWARIAHEAGQQSRRLRAPEILPAVRFEQALAEVADWHYLLDEAGAPPLLRQIPASLVPHGRVALLLGPEGGWTESERQSATVAGWTPASLGPQVLRAETAGAAAVAILLNAWCV